MRRALLALTVLMGFAQTSNAVIILYSTGFESPTYSDGALNNPVPATDTTTPGQDGWLNSSGGGTNNILASNTGVNGLVTLTTSGQDVRHPFAAVTSGSVFFDADVTVTSAQATGDYAMHFTDGGVANFYARTYFKSSGAGFVMAMGTSAGTAVTYGSTVLPFATPFHLLVRYDFVAGAGNDTGALFINPTSVDGTSDTPYVAATTIGTDATSIAALAMRQGSATNAAAMTIDNYQAFTPVPEPTSLALLGIACGGVIVRRRRKKKLPTA